MSIANGVGDDFEGSLGEGHGAAGSTSARLLASAGTLKLVLLVFTARSVMARATGNDEDLGVWGFPQGGAPPNAPLTRSCDSYKPGNRSADTRKRIEVWKPP